MEEESNDWNEWRGQLSEAMAMQAKILDRLTQKFEDHEKQEFAYQSKIEVYMASSLESRKNMDAHLVELGDNQKEIKTEVETVKSELSKVKSKISWLVGIITVVLAVGGALSTILINHLANHPAATLRASVEQHQVLPPVQPPHLP